MVNEEFLFRIAKIIDNSFIGAEDSFRCEDLGEYYYLTSGRCDDSSLIRVYKKDGGVGRITRVGPDTDDYIDIMPKTYERLKELNL